MSLDHERQPDGPSQAQLQALMREPGATLVFIDDTNFHGSSVRRLAPDLRVLVGVRIDSGHYAGIEAAMRQRLAEVGEAEFHAAEMVNPDKEGPWRRVSFPDRIAAFKFLGSLIERSCAEMRYIHVSKEQYAELRRAARDAGYGDFGLERDAGLKRVMLRCVLEELALEGRPAMVVIDQDRVRDGIEQDGSEDAPWLLGGGVLTAPSHLVAGLQIADALAYAVGRRFRRDEEFNAGNAKALDQAALEPLAALNGRSIMVLSADAGRDKARVSENPAS